MVTANGTRRAARLTGLAWYGSLVAVAMVIAVPVLVRLTEDETTPDIMLHAALSADMVRDGGWISYSVWYLLLQAVTLGSTELEVLRIASVVLLAVFIAVRAVVVFVIAKAVLQRPDAAWLVAIASILVMPLINPAQPHNIYLGQLTANVWHNSTNILAAPFVIALFAAAVVFLRRASHGSATVVSALAVASVLAKPNFALAFLPALGVAALVCLAQQGVAPARRAGMLAVILAPVTVLLAIQYVLVFAMEDVRSTTLEVQPFAIWSLHSGNIPLSLLLSLAGPAVALLAMDRAQRRSLPVVLAWAVVAVAIIQLSLFAEVEATGELASSANWFWGGYLAVLVLFVVSLIEVARAALARPQTRRVAVVVAVVVMGLHVISGVVYAGGIALAGNSPF